MSDLFLWVFDIKYLWNLYSYFCCITKSESLRQNAEFWSYYIKTFYKHVHAVKLTIRRSLVYCINSEHSVPHPHLRGRCTWRRRHLSSERSSPSWHRGKSPRHTLAGSPWPEDWCTWTHWWLRARGRLETESEDGLVVVTSVITLICSWSDAFYVFCFGWCRTNLVSLLAWAQ